MTEIPPQAQLGKMITGYWTSQAIYAAAKFGIADLLADGPKPVEDLATATGTRPELLYRLLRALASVGIFAEHPEKARIFDDAMTGIHGRETGAILDAFDFSGINVIADIGGGNGSKITAILRKYPEMTGILFDLPHVVERARPKIEEAGLSARCKLVSGDFFQSVPSGADAYVMRHIIHDWDDDKSLTILGHCHAVTSQGDKLLLVESVIPSGNDAFMGKFLDLTMMLIPGGKERTEDEYRELYDRAGFDLARIVPTSTEVSVIEGIRR